LAQDLVTTFNYMREGENLEKYYEHQFLLPFLNNEVFHPNFYRYRNNVMALNSFSMVQWDNDFIIYPRESSQFGQLSTSEGVSGELGTYKMLLKRDFDPLFN